MSAAPSNHPQGAMPQSSTWLCYILLCADGTLYTGATNDLDKRLVAHNAGTAAKYTRARRPVELAFVEVCADKSAALRREMAIKALSRAEKLELVDNQEHRARRLGFT
jgi:putative endonuclease